MDAAGVATAAARPLAPGAEPAPAVEWSGVTKIYRDAARPVLDGVTLRLSRGEWAFLTGPSGAGKTTLLRLAYGATRPTAGVVRVLGENIASRPLHLVRRRLGLVFQSFELLPNKTALGNVAYGAEILGASPADARRRAMDMLEAVGMAEARDRLPSALSGGEQQRVGLARALIHRPAVILADEPTGNLDLDNARMVFDILARIHREWSPAILVATHSSELIAWAERRVIRVQDGRVTEDRP